MGNAVLDEAYKRVDDAADRLFAAAEKANKHGGAYLEALVDAAYDYHMADKNLKAITKLMTMVNGKTYTVITLKSR